MGNEEHNEKIRFGDDLVKEFFKLDDPKEERRLFWARPTLNKESWLNILRSEGSQRRGAVEWRKRFDQWECHLAAYEKIGDPGTQQKKESADSHGIWRIDKLNKHLDTLDTKIGMALSFNSLLFAAAAFSLSRIPSLVGESKCISQMDVFLDIFNGLAFVILFLLLANLGILLRGFRRVVWGDLCIEGITHKKPIEKEKEYAGFLIISVARRTNTFRISTYVTRWVLILLALLFLTAGSFSFLKNRWCPETSNCIEAKATSARPGEASVEINGGNVQFGDIAPSPSSSPDGAKKSLRTESAHPGADKGIPCSIGTHSCGSWFTGMQGERPLLQLEPGLENELRGISETASASSRTFGVGCADEVKFELGLGVGGDRRFGGGGDGRK